MTAHLPTVGASSGVWGDELNEFLGTGHNADGTVAPAGADTLVQFNDNGILGADSTFTFNKSTNVLSVESLKLDASTTISIVSNNLTFTDAITGSRTLKQIGCPVYHYIKAVTQSEGDLHLTDTTWTTSKAIIKTIRIITSSTDWDLYILQNDNGYSADDADFPALQLVNSLSGNANIKLDMIYEDEDDSDEVHLYWIDNSGSNSADIYIKGTELL